MLAMFGMPGPLEMLIMGLLCLMMVGVPVIIIAVVLLVNRKSNPHAAKPCSKCGMLAPERGYCPHCGMPMDAA